MFVFGNCWLSVCGLLSRMLCWCCMNFVYWLWCLLMCRLMLLFCVKVGLC